MTSQSLINDSKTTDLDVYSCTPFKGDTAVVKGVKISLYCVIMLCSVLGNSILIAIIRRNKRMQTLTNYLIANMAVSDILLTALAVPRKLVEIVLGPRRWLVDGLVGSILCKSVFFFQDISTGVSILSLAVIAIDRYRGIVFPFQAPLVKRKFYYVILLLIWIVPMGIHSPYFYTVRVLTFDNDTYYTFSWAPKFDDRKTQEKYFATVFSFLIILPTCVVTVLYSVIIMTLKKGITKCKSSSSGGTSRRLQEDARVVRNILAILFGFVFCITPISAYAMLFYFVWKWKMPCGMENFGFAAHLILYLNAFVNPCIYFALNDKYRQGLKEILKSIFNRWKRTPLVQSSLTTNTDIHGRKRAAGKNGISESVKLVALTTC